MKLKGIYNIIDNTLKPYLTHIEIAKEILKGGGRILQLRGKDIDSRNLLNIAIKIKELIGDKAIFIINDRVDIAMVCNADGVHIGQEDIPLKEVKKIYNKIIGVSTHSKEEALKAYKEGADYISFGPVFKTFTKKDALSPRGIYNLKEIKNIIPIPVIAIGGINENNIYEVLNTGVEGVAIISAIVDSPDISQKMSMFKRIIDNFNKEK
jgi:thiamine-phosphate pyrophosphorylase